MAISEISYYTNEVTSKKDYLISLHGADLSDNSVINTRIQSMGFRAAYHTNSTWTIKIDYNDGGGELVLNVGNGYWDKEDIQNAESNLVDYIKNVTNFNLGALNLSYNDYNNKYTFTRLTAWGYAITITLERELADILGFSSTSITLPYDVANDTTSVSDYEPKLKSGTFFCTVNNMKNNYLHTLNNKVIGYTFKIRIKDDYEKFIEHVFKEAKWNQKLDLQNLKLSFHNEFGHKVQFLEPPCITFEIQKE